MESNSCKEEYKNTVKVWDSDKFEINGLKVLIELYYSWSGMKKQRNKLEKWEWLLESMILKIVSMERVKLLSMTSSGM